MQIVFQDPYASLNPRMKVGDIVGEPLVIHNVGNKERAPRSRGRAAARVGLDPDYRNRYATSFPEASGNGSVWRARWRLTRS